MEEILKLLLILTFLFGYLLFWAYCNYQSELNAKNRTIQLGQDLPLTAAKIKKKKMDSRTEKANAHLVKASKLYDQAVAHLEADRSTEANKMATQGLLHLQLAEVASGEPVQAA